MDSSEDSDNDQIEINDDGENRGRFKRKIEEIIQQRMNDRENNAGSSVQNLESESIFEDLLVKMLEQNEHEESHNRDEEMYGLEDIRDSEVDFRIAESLQLEEIFGFSRINVRSNQTEQNIEEDSEESDKDDLAEDIGENEPLGAENDFNDEQFEDLFNEEMTRIDNLSPDNNSQSSEGGRGFNDEFSDNLDYLIEDELDKTLESFNEETDNTCVIVNVSNKMSQIRIEENDQTKAEEIKPFQCQLCLEDHSLDESEGFGCSHIYCRECLEKFFISKIDDGQVFEIKCPAEECSLAAEDSLIRSLVSHEKIIRYEQLLLKNVTDKMDDIMNCPECNMIVECDLSTGYGICQECNYAFCTSCRKAFHGFDDCSQIQRRSEDNEKTETFIRQNLKKCPGCETNIEKDEIGCNHMTCRQCKTQFCWICLTKLTSDKLELERHYLRNCILFDHDFVD